MVSYGAAAAPNYACGIGPAFAAIGGKWKAALLWELREGPLRYGELKRRIQGVTEKMLIQQLRELERDQLITRQMFPQVPPRVDYQLTEWGVRLNAALAPVADWGEAYAKATGAYPGD
jgi:DNA-binding HxlR family transcriptional regulator